MALDTKLKPVFQYLCDKCLKFMIDDLQNNTVKRHFLLYMFDIQKIDFLITGTDLEKELKIVAVLHT